MEALAYPHVRRSSGTARGFTLVELLVVIGIIALLISILLPSLNRAREAGRRVKCLSNMRQIVMAMNMFSQDNHGWMPARADAKTFTIIDASNRLATISDPGLVGFQQAQTTANWIAWTRVTDPFDAAHTTGKSSNTAGDQNITFSGLAKYLGVKLLVHNTANNSVAANDASNQLDSVFRCPSDDFTSRFNSTTAGTPVYHYSYAANDLYMVSTKNNNTGNGYNVNTNAPPPAPYNDTKYGTVPANMRSDGLFNGRISSLHAAADKVLLYCQDPAGLDDGIFTPNPYNAISAGVGGNDQMDLLSSKHDFSRAATKQKNGGLSNTAAPSDFSVRGNVVMADGHGEFMTRQDSLRQIHTGNPFPDPKPWN